ncbi:MAG: RagB/SusD family nutrient uptake outer membrane protein [Bacteroidaceae bacterium]|nr:RagB/SusD family nutrient uptake outer membrane protein [Bacteroidaceae bacterium]
MNKINKILSLVLLGASALGLTGCGDFLFIEPKTFVSEDNFWNEKTDIDQMVAGVYVSMQSGSFVDRCIMWGETRSDNITEGLDASRNTTIYRVLTENLLPTNAYTDWSQFYSIINQCNIIIERAPEVSEKDPVYTESDLKATQAEMACIRDLCYFYLIRAFKDVPFSFKAKQSELDVEYFAPAKGDSIVPVLIADLEDHVNDALKAYPKDNSRDYNPDCNRITQNAIYALLTDLCLWNGDYAKAVDYAQRVIDAKMQKYIEDYSSNLNQGNGGVALFQHAQDTYSKGFPLYPCFSGSTFGNNFDAIFGEKMCSFESIFELSFLNNGSNGSKYLGNSSVYNLYGNHMDINGSKGQGVLAADENIVYYPDANQNALYTTSMDVRYFTDIYNPGAEKKEYTSGYSNKYTAISSSVYLTEGRYLASNSYHEAPDRNWIIYRLTDVMLMQAEALIQLGGETMNIEVTQDDGTKVNKYDDNLARAFYLIWAVNRRSIMVNNLYSSSYELRMRDYSTKDALMELVMTERRRELMFEGKRWFDLLRRCRDNGGAPDYIKSKVPAKGSGKSTSTALFVNPESLYWPYNKQEVINNPYLTQKSFYGSGDEDKGYESSIKK